MERIVKAVRVLLDTFPELHTRFVSGEKGEVRQWYDPTMVIPVVSRKCSEAELQAYFDGGFVRPFDLFSGEPLFRVEVVETERRMCLLSDGHHSIVDGMSFAMVLTTTFAKIVEGEIPERPAYGMYDAAENEVESFGTAQYERAKAYYAEKFGGLDMATLSKNGHGVMGKMGRRSSFVSKQACDDWSKEHGVAVNLLFQAAFSHVIGVLTRQEKVAYFTVNHGRMDKRLRGSVGMFVKSVPFLADGTGDPTVLEYIRRLRTELMSTIRYGSYPFTHFCMDLGMTPGVMFNFQAMASMEEHLMLGDMELSVVQPVREDMDGDAGVLIFLKGDKYEIRVESSLAMNDEATLQLLADAIHEAVCQMMANADGRLSEIEIVSAEEQEKLVELGCGGTTGTEGKKTFVTAFEEMARQDSERLAVADADESLSYGELSRRSDVLARRLIACGVVPNDFVAVMLDRTIAFPLAVLAIHKAGAAYVPIDLDYPEERQKYMLKDSEAKVVIDSKFIAETDFSEEVDPVNLSSRSGLAYMIYTSGSTGQPKGAVIHQAGLWNFIENMIAVEELTASDRIAGHRSFSFDAHIQDLFPILTVGGSFHIMPSSIRLDLDAIRRFLFEHQITGGGFTTNMAKLLLDAYNDLPQRFVSAGGEKLSSVYSDHITIINGYGPTECTCDTSCYKIEPGRRLDNVPIGRPFKNCYYFLVDHRRKLVPRGAVGELCFAGIQVGRGYWKKPELTAEVFTDCPFLPLQPDGKPVPMYLTGDLCRWNADGQMEYVARKDHQVKLRGYRIELGEIEACALSMEGMRQVAAVIRKVAGTDTLCLYYTGDGTNGSNGTNRTNGTDGTNGTNGTNGEIDKSALRNYLYERLASYMVPTVYVQLDSMPLTPNGKIDRRHLPEPPHADQAEYVAPRNKTEEILARLMGDVLSLQEPISMLDNFFSLGGDSIKLMQLVSMLRNEGYTAQMSELMKCSTVGDIASVLKSNSGPVISQEAVMGVVKPGAIQQRFLSWQLTHAEQFTQSLVLRASQPINPEHLQQALQALVIHHDMLRATVGDSIVIRPTTDENLFAFKEMTLSWQTDVAHDIAEISISEGQQIDLERGPILRTVLLHAADGDRLLMVCHHISIDGVSWHILAEDLITALTQLGFGQPIKLPLKTHSFAYWTDAVSRYRDSYLLRAEKSYWQRVQELMEGQELTAVTNGSKTTRQVTVTLQGEPLKQLLTKSIKAYNTDVNDLLLTALSQAYHKQTGNNCLTIQMEAHGREPLHEPLVIDRTVGWFTSSYPIVIQDINGDIRHDVRQTKELLRAVPNKGVGYGILQYIASQEGDSALRTDLTPLMGFNYLGEVTSGGGDAPFTADSSMFLHQRSIIGELGLPVPSVDINCGIANGQLLARFEYDAECWTDDRVRSLADAFIANLIQVAAFTANADAEPTASDFGAAGWTDLQLKNIEEHLAKRGETLQHVYPLTPMQEGILLTYLTDQDTAAYRLLFRLSLNILPSETMLRNTLDYLAEKYEVLRTAIFYDGILQPCQAVVQRKLGLEMRDLTGESDIEEAASRVHQELLHRPLSLTDDPMFHLVCMKTGADSCQLLVVLHHIIIDGWGIPVVFKDFLTKLEAEVAGQTLSATMEQTGRYESFVRQLLRKDRKAGLNYWKELLADYDTRAAIPSYGENDTQKASPRIKHLLDKTLTTSMRQLAASTGVTLNTVMELGWGLVLQMYCRTEDVVFARVVSGRDDADSSMLVGLFINSVPVRVHTESTLTVTQALKALQEQSAQSSAYDYCPLSEIQTQTQLGASLFQSVMAFENYPVDDSLFAINQDWGIKAVQVEEEPFCELALGITPERDGTLSVTFTYDTSLYSEQQMKQVAETYENIIRSMADMCERQIGELPFITSMAQAELTTLGAGKHIDVDPEETFVDLFEKQASKTPQSLAVADGMRSMTYGELSHHSDVLAHQLIACGVCPNDFVVVKVDHTIDFPLAVLAIHKAGAAYVPIDLDYPEERQAYMLDDCKAKIVIDEQFLAETDFNVESDPVDLATPEGLAYMIYTSGSTGRPKGVMLRQCGLRNYIASMVDVQELTSADRIALHRAFSFDAHIQDLYPVLTVGGSLHIMPSEIRHELQGIRDFIINHGITGGCYTTSLGVLLKESGPLPLRYLAMSGERMVGLVSDDVQVLNCYGPTECTDLISTYRLEHNRTYTNIPIGRPMANGYCFIVDKHNRLLPRGASGELCFASVQVSVGYWNHPELTAEKFCDCPFLPCDADGKPVRMYHTGDLCRWNSEGQIEFLGRLDELVKLRGFRIELGEIEACAKQFEGVSQAVAAIRKIGTVDVLCLYYTGDGTNGAEAKIDEDALRDHLAQSLAEYMVPVAYIQLDEMPLLPNGKIDRKRMPEPEFTQEIENVAPTTEKESLLLLIARQILGRNDFGTTDDLIALGLTSIGAIKLAATAAASGVKISVNSLMRQHTIVRLLGNTSEPGYWYNAYSPDKPVLVVPHGIVYAINMAGKLNRWQQRFSIYAIEPTDEHADRLFPDADFHKMIDTYIEMLDRDIPRDAKVQAFMGYSWGGEQAYWLAKRWQELRGECANVYMGDSHIHNKNYIKMDDAAIAKEAMSLAGQHHIDIKSLDQKALQAALKLAVKKIGIAERMHCDEPFPVYDGHVTLFNALRDNPDMENNLEQWKRVAPKLKVVDVDANHLDFVLGDQYIGIVTKEIEN